MCRAALILPLLVVCPFSVAQGTTGDKDEAHARILRQARMLEARGEDLYQLSDIGEAARLWNEALDARQQAFGDSSAEAAVGYAYQARYHNYMAAPQLDHKVLARQQAERAKHLLHTQRGNVNSNERILILREYAYAFKVSEMSGTLDDHQRLSRTRSHFREALRAATSAQDTVMIAQITHDIGNTFTDEAGRYNQELPPPRLRILVDSGLWHYRRSIALMTAAGKGDGESVMMDHFTTALMYRSAYGGDSAVLAVAAYDRALRTMLRSAGRAADVDPLIYEPHIANKAQMVELLYLRSLSFADPYVDHTALRFARADRARQLEPALRSLEAAVPYWEAMLREYKSRELHKVIGSYSHFPFRYGTYLAAELFQLTGDSARLRQAIDWSERNRNGSEQRDLLRTGRSPRTSPPGSNGSPYAPPGSMMIAFHDHPRLLAFVNTASRTHLMGPTTGTATPKEISAWGRQLREAMHANDIRAYQRTAFALYQSTIAPALRNEDLRELVIVPSERMGTIPFEALVTDTIPAARWSDLHYVQDRWQVRYARTMREALAPTTDLPDHPTRFMVAQASARSLLPFAMQLAREREGWYHGPVTRAAVLGSMQGKAPLHLATHAEVPAQPDALPHLLLDDGPLSMSELDSAQCNSPFVVLSTCSSGEGRVYIGEGTLSLAHSFLRSGAKAVVQTLWPVDDQATSEILGLMYAGMDNGQTASEALAEAKLDFVKEHADDALSNPFYWSGIVLTGSEVRPAPGSQWMPQGRDWFWWTSAAAVLLAAAGYRSFRRSRRSRDLAAN